MSHTLGPWYTIDQPWGDGRSIGTQMDPHQGRFIATVDFLGCEEDEEEIHGSRDCLADARLIAAAPELLEVCKRLLEDIRRYTQIDHAEYISVCQQAVVAIAKAEQP